MSEDVKCPYCGSEQEINHDDGYGYEEDEVHQQECGECGKTFGYETTILYYYDAQKLPCANGEPHEWEPTITYPKHATCMICKLCGERRVPTIAEKKEFGIPGWGE